jgi:hypothetical protein
MTTWTAVIFSPIVFRGDSGLRPNAGRPYRGALPVLQEARHRAAQIQGRHNITAEIFKQANCHRLSSFSASHMVIFQQLVVRYG